MPGARPTIEPTTWWRELRALAGLSGPIALANLAQIAMGTTDVMMMGQLGPRTLAAGALGVNLYFIFIIFGVGLLNAVAPMIARVLGRAAPSVREVQRIVQQGLRTSVAIAIPAWLLLWFSEPLFLAMGQDSEIAALAGAYVRTLQWALLPVWGGMVLRSLVIAHEKAGVVLAIGLVSVLINATANWCFMLGHCGCRSFGIAGSGMATAMANLAMFGAIAAVAATRPPFRRYRVFSGLWRPDWPMFRALWRLGLPMAATASCEVSVFNVAVFLMGLLGPAPLAAHAIAIQFASLTFMVPLGIGQAVSVRVGRAFGAQDRAAIGRAGWAAFCLAVGFMATMSLALLLAPRLLISAFLGAGNPPGDPGGDPANTEVIALATEFLMCAALFQIADGVQAVGSGMLRGLHDVRMPMLFAVTGYWGIGFPLGVLLAFPLGLGGIGIWIGLATGLGVVACLMMRRWARRAALGLLPPW